MSPANKISGYVVLTFKIYPEDGQYVSECRELGTASCGDTIDEALQNIREASVQFLNAIEANGERDRIFRKRNIPVYPGLPENGQMVAARDREVVALSVLPIRAA